MNKARLEELRKRVFVDYQEWDVKCSQDGFQEASPTGEMDADGKDLTTLIDAELTRQSVTDEAVRVAIDWLEAEKESAQNSWERAGAEWRIEPGTQEMHDEQMAAFDLAIQALCQCQFPSAIQWTGKNLREVIDLVGLNPSANEWTWTEYKQVVAEKGLKIFTPDGPVMAEIGDWIIQNGKDCFVTRQMRTEPCEICGNFKRIECKADNLEFIAVRCPNCGRYIGGDSK